MLLTKEAKGEMVYVYFETYLPGLRRITGAAFVNNMAGATGNGNKWQITVILFQTSTLFESVTSSISFSQNLHVVLILCLQVLLMGITTLCASHFHPHIML
jgi:hypothetical protein